MVLKRVQLPSSASDGATSSPPTRPVFIPADNSKDQPANTRQNARPPSAADDTFRSLFGFEKRDLLSWTRFVRLLCRPTDPAALGTLRFLYGFLMILDILKERGHAMHYKVWANGDVCRFPLFSFLKPLPLQWMFIVYLVMFMGAAGIMLGFRFRISCMMYLGTYWYIFFLDKTTWTNHSYLFGVLAFLFAISDANRYWSIDGFLDPKICNAHVPLWNYTLFRAQIFLVYFIAGLKKLDMDWVTGYSMQWLSDHWVFDPFKMILTDTQTDLFIIHLGGLCIDLFVGFLLFFDKTRIVGLILCTSFNSMNAVIFHIGMFPYTMLAAQILFCEANCPRKLFNAIPPVLRLFTPNDADFQPSLHCIYTKEQIKSETLNVDFHASNSLQAPHTTASLKHKLASLFTIVFITWQCFLPYSHGITKGYNNWTSGLYGYSWDMMVYNWDIQHIRITYVDKDTNRSGYLDPMTWFDVTRRWSRNGDMIKQYADCIAERLQDYGVHNVELYFDIWGSLNQRFQQRMIDPRIDMVSAQWHPFKSSSWMMPLLVNLSDWRGKFNEIYESMTNNSFTDVVFLADFPGMHLENYIQTEINTSIVVLAGKIVVELPEIDKNITLGPDESFKVPVDTFHNVYTISETPSCFMYLFINQTDVKLHESYLEIIEDFDKTSSLNETLKKYSQDPNLWYYMEMLLEKQLQETEQSMSQWDNIKAFLKRKYTYFRKGLRLSKGALSYMITNNLITEFVNAILQGEEAITMGK